MKCETTWIFILKVLSFLRITGIPFGFLWCFDALKLLSCLQCCRSVADRGELISTLCTGIVTVPAVTLFRKIYKPLHSRSLLSCISPLISFVTLEVWKMCAMYEWMRTLFDSIIFCTGHSRGEEQALDCRSSSVDCVFIPSVTLIWTGRLTVVRLQQGCSSLGVFCPRVI